MRLRQRWGPWVPLVLTALLAGLISPAAAGRAPVLRTAASGSMAPWGLVDSTGAPGGILHDYKELLAAKAGVRLQTDVMPTSRLNVMAMRGDIDLFIFPDVPAVETCCLRLARVYEFTYGLLRTGHPLATAADPGDRPVCRLNRSSINLPGVRVVNVGHYGQCFRMGAAGRVAAIFGPRSVLAWTLQNMKTLPPLQLSSFLPVRRVGIGLYVSRKYPDQAVMARLRRAAGEINVEHLLNKYVKTTAIKAAFEVDPRGGVH